MFQNTYPVFEAKRLLKKEMLENLRDFPRNLFDLQYQAYSDGILTGCAIKGNETGLTILPGVVLYKGVPYFLTEPYSVSHTAEGKLVYVKVHFWDKAIGTGGEEFFSQIVVDEQEPDAEQEMELARFKLQPGARLRSEYVNFYDYETEFDTVICIHAPYAAPEHSSMCPQICQSFAREMMKHPITDTWDSAFCISCLQMTETMSYEALRGYLNMRLGRNREYTNAQIYAALKSILRENGRREDESGCAPKKEGTLLMI